MRKGVDKSRVKEENVEENEEYFLGISLGTIWKIGLSSGALFPVEDDLFFSQDQ
jgi:hypothetical protein